MNDLILVTGATGYVGGRLVPRLIEAGNRVRVLVRDPAHLQGRAWINQVEIFQGDALDPGTLHGMAEGVQAAYYLIHSMRSGEDFRARDVSAARNFAQAIEGSRIQRIIYLGGLGDPEKALSEHLRSRQEVGKILTEADIPVIEFRSAIIVGSASASFEMIRYVVEGLPIIICPPWVRTRVQPISIRDVIDYFINALSLSNEKIVAHQVIEIGGAEVLTYHDMMYGYAKARGLKRWMIILPWLPIRLCANWLQWITPIPAGMAYVLIESIRNDVVVRDQTASRLFPQIQPRDYKTSLDKALLRISTDKVETTWSDAQGTYTGDVRPVTLTTYEGLLLERRQRMTKASARMLYLVFTRLGGKNGWLHANWIWLVRGMIDRLVGGPGFRRGRRHAEELRVGDAVDFWRVEAIQPDRMLRLRAEMKVPGLAWLQFEVTPYPDGENLITQTAFFEPKGLPGLIYWYLLYPIHARMFSMLIQKIVEKGEAPRTR